MTEATLEQMWPIITQEENEKLRKPFGDDEVELLPDKGFIYIPAPLLIHRLCDVFGAGNWMLKLDVTNDKIARGYVEVRGRRVTPDTLGSYDCSFSSVEKDDAEDSAKSFLVKKCCKYLGMGRECYQSKYQKEWLGKYAEKVWCQHAKDSKKDKYLWLKKGEDPIYPYSRKKTATNRQTNASTQDIGSEVEVAKPKPDAKSKVKEHKSIPEDAQELIKLIKTVDKYFDAEFVDGKYKGKSVKEVLGDKPSEFLGKRRTQKQAVTEFGKMVSVIKALKEKYEFTGDNGEVKLIALWQLPEFLPKLSDLE